MIVDTSVLVAILLNEPDAEILTATLAATSPRMISTVSAINIKLAQRFDCLLARLRERIEERERAWRVS